MNNTKEAILVTALELFGRDGYEGVSVSQIAEQLGMTKGALYKHYTNKRDIFDHILRRMEEMDGIRAGEFGLPEGTLVEMEEKYRCASLDQLGSYCKAQFAYWTEDGFAASFRRMLTLEQFRNEEMQALYQQYLVGGPVAYCIDLLRSMGISRARERAGELYASMFLFYSLYDGAEDRSAVTQWLGETVDRWIENTVREEADRNEIDRKEREAQAEKEEGEGR